MDSTVTPRNRQLGSGDKKSMLSSSMLAASLCESEQDYTTNSGRSCILAEAIPPQLGKLFTDNVYLADPWHDESFLHEAESDVSFSTWKLKERMKTVGVALVVCLNIGTDPPDVVKPHPCARKECWFDPTGPGKQKGLEIIGNSLQQQYEKWQSKAKYKQCLDPTLEDLRRVCINLRKIARNDRLLLHYNGHGVPKPTKNGELWVFGKHYTHYMPVAISDVRSWLGDPAIYVLDCSGAGALLPYFADMPLPAGGSSPSRKEKGRSGAASLARAGLDGPTILLAACKADETLPVNPQYPADIFTACLTTQITIALRWFILQNPHSMSNVDPDLAENIPGKDNDRKTPRGELNWIFTAITDTIAWTTLPSAVFQKMFRQDLLVASLFRNFLLAMRIMKSFKCTPQSWPPLPDSTTHPLWLAWDLAAESCISHVLYLQRGGPMLEKSNMGSSTSSFFVQQLTAFEVWLDFGDQTELPVQMPVLLQVLLSQTHRLRALLLLRRYLALGPHAVNLALLVGIFPYILKLLQSPAADIRQVLICIWASILGFDSQCRQELIRDKCQSYFVQHLHSPELPVQQRCMSAFILAEICNGHREGQQTCLQQGLHRSCSAVLAGADTAASPCLRKWIALCFYKLCEDFLWAKYLCLTENAHKQLYPLLTDADAPVRASAVLALGELFGASLLSSTPSTAASPLGPGGFMMQQTPAFSTSNFSIEQHELMESELQLALQLLEKCTDGSVLVRREAVIALSKFVFLPTHVHCLILIARALIDSSEDKQASLPSRRPVSSKRSSITDDPKDAFPWILSPQISESIVHSMQSYLESIGMSKLRRGGGSESLLGEELPPARRPTDLPDFLREGATRDEGGGSDPPQAAVMATAYVRLWFALSEVCCRDPHQLVSSAAESIAKRVYEMIDTVKKGGLPLSASLVSMSADNEVTLSLPPHLTKSGSLVGIDQSKGMQAQLPQSPLIAPLSPVGVGFSRAFSSSQSLLSGSGKESPGAAGVLGAGGIGLNRSIDVADAAPGERAITSHLYNWTKKLFLAPDKGYDPYLDDLSDLGMSRLYRSARLQEVLAIDKSLSHIFRDVDDRHDHILDRKAKEEAQMAKASIVNSLPPSVTKFEQRSIINVDNVEMTSLVVFHAFQDVLAVTDGHKVGVWSLANSSKVLEIDSKAGSTKGRSTSPARVTALSWINESYDALLMVGSDDGAIRVYKDAPEQDAVLAKEQAAEHTGPITTGGSKDSQGRPSLVTSFVALPDVAETTRGSGMVMSWLQHTGNLIVGGNSNSIRVWDLSREQCVRAFTTGLDTCTTALASQSVAEGGALRDSAGVCSLSWTFAGFADGAVGLFDERTPSGQVFSTRDNSAWIVSAHLRADVPEVITGSVRGIVKFWDLRTMRTFKTFEVFKSPLTALAVHNCAPIMATGSHAQFIKVLTLGGDQLGNIIKYHDGFLGQRIGPVSCLAFHPVKMVLAAGAMDSIVSIYSTPSSINEPA